MASEPDKWDYALAGVPSPLTDELESQQMAKQVGDCNSLSRLWLVCQASRVAMTSASVLTRSACGFIHLFHEKKRDCAIKHG